MSNYVRTPLISLLQQGKVLDDYEATLRAALLARITRMDQCLYEAWLAYALIDSLEPGDAGTDFRMSVRLPSYLLTIYIDLGATDNRNVQTHGVIAVSVPTPHRHMGLTPDGKTWIEEIVSLTGTDGEKKKHHFGSSGNNFRETLEYFSILKRYLDSGAQDSW